METVGGQAALQRARGQQAADRRGHFRAQGEFLVVAVEGQHRAFYFRPGAGQEQLDGFVGRRLDRAIAVGFGDAGEGGGDVVARGGLSRQKIARRSRRVVFCHVLDRTLAGNLRPAAVRWVDRRKAIGPTPALAPGGLLAASRHARAPTAPRARVVRGEVLKFTLAAGGTRNGMARRAILTVRGECERKLAT